ncbi:urease accessory protein UreF [Litchfieldia salsa]|uniref:Urease accessory protein UreF n=1 Tax=Litchfieldia salsa TaxID=930152 RepID=A0A1H0PUI1_9BACI|nr:urease accessory protein UreF [Litchfieldia salsa]SDP08801.1 urease accessory protein [Litchfieldia salsa]
MDNDLFPLLQLCDSNFPSGAFSHSFGLETYIQEQIIVDKESFKTALSVFVDKQLVFSDGLACRLSYEVLESGRGMDELLEIDRLLFVSTLAKETREGNRRIEERMAKLCMDLYAIPALGEYLYFIKNKQGFGHSALVFAFVAHHLQIDKEKILSAYLFASVSSLTQNAVRGVPLGQTDGQRLLVEIQVKINEAKNTIMKLTKDDLGAVSPGLEIAQMRHERLPVRLFMS